MQLRTISKCQCKVCTIRGVDADDLAIVPYEVNNKENVDPCNSAIVPYVGNTEGVSQDCICCNVLRTVSYELVFLVLSSLCKTSYGIKFLWNQVFRMLS